ncbi:NAD(P)-dependent dehydrogenase (short-subunit alcohol dehydrogenase family) [Paenibacillus sp. W4I10]|nr:NAD(P)-dependent dehydrogenase (short-subunit alcohol dehydrogenase family) [Paenibacillus sp. W4I10]
MKGMNDMDKTKVWFITGAGRGMGTTIAKAALNAGHKVVATGRNPDAVVRAIGDSENVMVVPLDVCEPADAHAAVKAAIERFGAIDVLVNNAAHFCGGYFEELTPDQIEHQLQVALVGSMHVTRAILPVMRTQRSGHVISISSGAGISGFEYNSAYSAAKFALEGWMEALAPEVAPFGIHTTIVNPGFFRTEFLTDASSTFAKPSIEDYDDRRAGHLEFFNNQNGQQPGDPKKLANALLQIANEAQPPQRFIAGADAIDIAEQKIANLQTEINAYRDLSKSMAYDN